MKDYSRSSATGREEFNPSCQVFLVPWPEWARATVGGTVLGLVTLLHLFLIVYLTIPPVPPDEVHEPFTESSASALKVTFAKASLGESTPPATMVAPSAGHTLPTLSNAAEKKRHATASYEAGAPVESVVAPKDERTADARVEPEQVTNPTIAYRSPLLQGKPMGTSLRDPRRLPGHPDGALVSSVALSEPPSIRESLRLGGQFLNCSQVRIARFLSASEMDKRHITKQQLDQAFTEYGCT
ncbi:hypothetical protein [Dyella humicola]|uniref:hypothetical protein n=1 Tax=Dyella humicola TaxID=2992126 RepID=UPI0022519820|nr:hypothetical protein [Dyella humicola]